MIPSLIVEMILHPCRERFAAAPHEADDGDDHRHGPDHSTLLFCAAGSTGFLSGTRAIDTLHLPD